MGFGLVWEGAWVLKSVIWWEGVRILEGRLGCLVWGYGVGRIRDRGLHGAEETERAL